MRRRAAERGARSRRLLGLLAAPILVAQCAPTQCGPTPPEPPPVETTVPPETTTTTTTLPPRPPPPQPPASSSYAFLSTNAAGQYTRWFGCNAPVSWQFDTTVAPTQAVREAVNAALATAAAATGHSFALVGDAGPTLLPGVEAVIGVKDLSPGTLGLGGGRFTSSLEMVSGSVYVDDRFLAADPTTNPALAAQLRTTLIHELGHMLGLGHVQDNTQVMFGTLRSPPLQEYQSGDLAGLYWVGAQQPCYASLRTRSAAEPTTEIILE